MTADLDQTNELLAAILEQAMGIRFELVRSTDGINDVHSVLLEMKYLLEELPDKITGFAGPTLQDLQDKLEEVRDSITGASSGFGGATLDDVRNAVDAVENTISLSS